MKIYHAAITIKVLTEYKNRYPDKKIHALRSYGTRNHEDHLFRTIYRDACASLDLDSGAFSINNREANAGLNINFNGFMEYAKLHKKYYSRIYNFDCDFSDEGFETNIFYQKRMEDEGLAPVPVVHSIYDDEAEYYIKGGYETVALGSSQITDFGTLSYVMGKFRDTEIKIHLLGNTKFEFLTSFPIYSCDSTGWATRAKFGEIKWWNPKKSGLNKTDTIYLEEYIPQRPNVIPLSEYQYREDLGQYLWKDLGITEKDLLGPYGTYLKQVANLHYYLKLEEVVNQIHRQKGFWTAE